MEFIKKNAPGIILCLVIAVPSWLLGRYYGSQSADAARSGDLVIVLEEQYPKVFHE